MIVIDDSLLFNSQGGLIKIHYGIGHTRRHGADKRRVTLLDCYARCIVVDDKRIILNTPLPRDIERKFAGADCPQDSIPVGIEFNERMGIRPNPGRSSTSL